MIRRQKFKIKKCEKFIVVPDNSRSKLLELGLINRLNLVINCLLSYNSRLIAMKIWCRQYTKHNRLRTEADVPPRFTVWWAGWPRKDHPATTPTHEKSRRNSGCGTTYGYKNGSRTALPRNSSALPSAIPNTMPTNNTLDFVNQIGNLRSHLTDTKV